jgi:trehalose/maltose hydrolase-like predicted phosphorylase
MSSALARPRPALIDLRSMAKVAVLGIFCMQVSAALYPTSFNDTLWDDSAWSLTTTAADPGHYQSRASLSNGYIGINLASLGPFFEVDTPVNGDNILGWPLFDRRQTFATISGFFGLLPGFGANMTNFEWLNELGDESVISGIPHWAGLEVEYGDSYLDANTNLDEISAFSSTWNFRNATMEWQYTWTPSTGPSFNISYVMFLHKLYINQAFISISITASQVADVSVYDVLNGDCAVRTESAATGYEAENGTIWSSVKPVNIPYVTAYTYSKSVVDGGANYTRSAVPSTSHIGSNSSSIAQKVDITLRPRQPVTITKYVGIASSDAFEDAAATARNASINAAKSGFVASLESHAYEWNTHFTTNSVDSYHLSNGSLPNNQFIIDQQIMSVTNPYGIFQNTVGTNAIAAADGNPNLDSGSVAVCGLGASCYAGLIFWDAENWMASGIVVAHPQAAKQIANYRVAKFRQAQLNVNTAYLSSQANTSFAASSAIFPWTSGRFGNCTGTGPCFDYEYHINGDIGLELENLFYVTGDTAQFKDNYFPVYDAIAQLYSDLLFYNTTTGMYSLSNATDPDEYAYVFALLFLCHILKMFQKSY